MSKGKKEHNKDFESLHKVFKRRVYKHGTNNNKYGQYNLTLMWNHLENLSLSCSSNNFKSIIVKTLVISWLFIQLLSCPNACCSHRVTSVAVNSCYCEQVLYLKSLWGLRHRQKWKLNSQKCWGKHLQALVHYTLLLCLRRPNNSTSKEKLQRTSNFDKNT